MKGKAAEDGLSNWTHAPHIKLLNICVLASVCGLDLTIAAICGVSHQMEDVYPSLFLFLFLFLFLTHARAPSLSFFISLSHSAFKLNK